MTEREPLPKACPTPLSPIRHSGGGAMREQNEYTKLYCSPDRWVRQATAEALAHNMSPALLLAGYRNRKYSNARWRAWRALVAAGYSYKSIGAASGFDHTSVRHACLSTLKTVSAGGAKMAAKRERAFIRSIPRAMHEVAAVRQARIVAPVMEAAE